MRYAIVACCLLAGACSAAPTAPTQTSALSPVAATGSLTSHAQEACQSDCFHVDLVCDDGVTALCRLSATLDGVSVNYYVQTTWNWGDGTTSLGGVELYHTYAAVHNYTVTLTTVYSDRNGVRRTLVNTKVVYGGADDGL